MPPDTSNPAPSDTSNPPSAPASPAPAPAAVTPAAPAVEAKASPAKPAKEAQAEKPEAHKPVDGQPLSGTAYTLRQGDIELGLFFMGYGITDWLTVGTFPASWVIAPILGGVSINMDVKASVPIGKYMNVGLEVDPLWIKIDSDTRSTNGAVVPVNLNASLHPDERQSYTLGGRYVAVAGVNNSGVDDQEVAGTAITRVAQVLAQAQYQLTGAVAIYAQGSLQVWEQELQVDANSQLDDSTSVDVEGAASATNHSRPWSAIVGTHLRFGIVNLRLGVGYGNIFVPRIGLTARAYQGVVPDLDFYVRF
jgi:hypothetical protein